MDRRYATPDTACPCRECEISRPAPVAGSSNNPETDDGFEDDFRVVEATLRANHAPLATLDRLARIKARLDDAARNTELYGQVIDMTPVSRPEMRIVGTVECVESKGCGCTRRWSIDEPDNVTTYLCHEHSSVYTGSSCGGCSGCPDCAG